MCGISLRGLIVRVSSEPPGTDPYSGVVWDPGWPLGVSPGDPIMQCWLIGLKYLNYVAGGVDAENLLAPSLLHNVVSKSYTFVFEP